VRLVGPPGDLPPVSGVPDAIRVAATRLGHRPAVTVVRPDRRDEQGFASLQKWAAKGAHLLRDECGLSPGDRLVLDAPADWITTAVAYAAWWVGVAVTDGGDAGGAVVTDSRPAPLVDTVFRVGTAMDGAPADASAEEAWSSAVQAWPDEPPPEQGDSETTAVCLRSGTWTQAELLAESARWGAEGVLGVDADVPADIWLPAIVRPLRVGRPTVILDGATREAAAGERVDVWAADVS
jgi:hypothetical protein